MEITELLKKASKGKHERVRLSIKGFQKRGPKFVLAMHRTRGHSSNNSCFIKYSYVGG
jgi:hypothetical protein